MPDHRQHPRLRWHDETVTRAPIFVVPGESRDSSSVIPRGKTWGIRERGDTDKMVLHSYRCPVHGVFDLRVPVSDVPDEVACTLDEQTICLTSMPPQFKTVYCGLTSHWAGSTCAIGVEAGMVKG